jgi:hypothetical protein
MTQHVSKSINKRFCVRALPVEELATIAEHLDTCSTCLDQFTKTLQSRRGSAPLKFTLAPEFWIRNEHVDYEQLVRLSDSRMHASEREIIDLHLKVCGSCTEDVRSFIDLREQIAPELESFYDQGVHEPKRRPSWVTWRRGLAWRPIYAAALVLMGIGLVIGAAFLLKRRADNLQAKQPPTPNVNLGAPGQTPTPYSRAANSPSAPATPNEWSVEIPNSPAIALNDRTGIVTVDKSGKLAGLDDVSAPTREEIAKVLLSERIEQPAILKELGGQVGTLRGSKNTQPFRLSSPSRTVIVTDQPTLKWEKAPGASAYRVYVNDQAGHAVARSEDLPSERKEWILPKPLERGAIYIWTVVAVVDGKEIVSPDPSTPEMKFQVLSARNLQQLQKLKKTRSHLALGVFYAHVGMVAEAQPEFQILVLKNASSQSAKKLLREIQSWQTH